MATAFNTRKRIRRFFGHIESVAPMPNLIEVQKSSYESFLQRNIAGGQAHAVAACRRSSAACSRSRTSPSAPASSS